MGVATGLEPGTQHADPADRVPGGIPHRVSAGPHLDRTISPTFEHKRIEFSLGVRCRHRAIATGQCQRGRCRTLWFRPTRTSPGIATCRLRKRVSNCLVDQLCALQSRRRIGDPEPVSVPLQRQGNTVERRLKSNNFPHASHAAPFDIRICVRV